MPSGRSRTSSLKNGPTVEKGVSWDIANYSRPKRYQCRDAMTTARRSCAAARRRSPTIQRMRSHGLNCALAVIAIVAVVAACSRTTEQAEKTAARAVTFNGDIAPILFDNCASCHRPIDDAALRRQSLPRRSLRRRRAPPMIRSAWLVRRSACSTTTRFVATRARSRQPCSAARCRRGCPSPDTASSPANGGSATIRSRSSRSGSRAARPRGIRPTRRSRRRFPADGSLARPISC